MMSMAHPADDRPASTPDAADPPMPELPADLAPPPSIGPADAASPGAEVEPLGETPTAKRERVQVARTRTSAVWFGVWAGAVALILLIIFVGQNTASVEISFLWLSGRISLALALLIAGVGGAIIAMAVAAARILQLRRLFRRTR
jgi:uncharacterized integral membrane protein